MTCTLILGFKNGGVRLFVPPTSPPLRLRRLDWINAIRRLSFFSSVRRLPLHSVQVEGMYAQGSVALRYRMHISRYFLCVLTTHSCLSHAKQNEYYYESFVARLNSEGTGN